MNGLLVFGSGVSRGSNGRVYSLFDGNRREGLGNGGLVGWYDRQVQGEVVTHHVCSGEQMNQSNSFERPLTGDPLACRGGVVGVDSCLFGTGNVKHCEALINSMVHVSTSTHHRHIHRNMVHTPF